MRVLRTAGLAFALAAFAVGALREMRRDPPPPGHEILPADYPKALRILLRVSKAETLKGFDIGKPIVIEETDLEWALDQLEAVLVADALQRVRGDLEQVRVPDRDRQADRPRSPRTPCGDAGGGGGRRDRPPGAALAGLGRGMLVEIDAILHAASHNHSTAYVTTVLQLEQAYRADAAAIGTVPTLAAIDVMLQAEHGPDGLARLITWDEAVAEVGEGTARVWGLYMAGSRLGFERNEIQLHQVLATRTSAEGATGYPLRPDF